MREYMFQPFACHKAMTMQRCFSPEIRWVGDWVISLWGQCLWGPRYVRRRILTLEYNLFVSCSPNFSTRSDWLAESSAFDSISLPLPPTPILSEEIPFESTISATLGESSVGNVTGLWNPWVLPRVSLGYGLGYRILYPRKTRTHSTGMWVGAGLMAGWLAQIWSKFKLHSKWHQYVTDFFHPPTTASPPLHPPSSLQTRVGGGVLTLHPLPHFKSESEGDK